MLERNIATYEDNRGSLTPIDCKDWEQVNVSYNKKKYTFRGMHYQTNPPQTKMVKVVKGRIIDFLYDLETEKVLQFDLSNQQAVLVPDNYAHGFITLEDETIVTYLVKGEYNPNSEHSIVWNTIPQIKETIDRYIDNSELIISDKDMIGK